MKSQSKPKVTERVISVDTKQPIISSALSSILYHCDISQSTSCWFHQFFFFKALVISINMMTAVKTITDSSKVVFLLLNKELTFDNKGLFDRKHKLHTSTLVGSKKVSSVILDDYPTWNEITL